MKWTTIAKAVLDDLFNEETYTPLSGEKEMLHARILRDYPDSEEAELIRMDKWKRHSSAAKELTNDEILLCRFLYCCPPDKRVAIRSTVTESDLKKFQIYSLYPEYYNNLLE